MTRIGLDGSIHAVSGATVSFPIPASVANFRREFRKKLAREVYYGQIHVLWMLAWLVGSIVYSFAALHAARLSEWAIFAGALIFSSFVEYWFHRGPLHKPYRGVKKFYRVHTLEHHHYFTDEAMPFNDFKDFKMVLFPAYAHALVVIAMQLLARYVFEPFFSAHAGHLFAAGACFYFLAYELIHLIAHLRTDHPIFKIPPFGFLRDHHKTHHRLNAMSKVNFNIALPLFDWIFRTRGVRARFVRSRRTDSPT